MAYTRTYLSRLKELAFRYIEECENNTKEHVTPSGKIVKVADRKNPTIDYFLVYWLPKNDPKSGTIRPSTYYRWMNWQDTTRQAVIKEIDNLFKAIQIDVVANEGKGIAYAKHKFGWSDNTNTTITVEQPLFLDTKKVINVSANDSNQQALNP